MKKKKEIRQNRDGKKETQTLVKSASPGIGKTYMWLAAILVVSFLAYLPVLHNSLIAWDDDGYITTNHLIFTIDLKEIFSTYVKGNYHPLTMLVYAIEYKMFGINPTGYHLVNLILHLMNAILVFYVVFHFCGKEIVALVAALLFGIHPIHVESVAWASELKDLLYTFFFLASYIFYLKYLKDPKKKFYVFALLLFAASLLSKAMAASLPVVFLLTDYVKGRKINLKLILEKAPFFALAVGLGIVAVIAQKTAGATDVIYFSFMQRMSYASYSLLAYLFKIILPIQLCGYYPYPIENGVYVTTQYYIYLLALVALVAGVIYSLRFSNKLFFSLGFFAITIFLVLQLFPVGGALMADRYSYIPSIGIFYLAGEGVNNLILKNQKWMAIGLLSIYAIFLSVSTNQRCHVWKTTLIFWNDVISQYQTVPPAYYGRGIELMNDKKYDEAIKDFNKAIERKPDFTDAYINRGTVLVNQKKYDEAINDFNKAIQLKPNYEIVYNNRGKAYLNKNMLQESLNDYNKAIEIKPDFIEAFYNRGTLFLDHEKFDEALKDFNKTLELDPKFIDAYINRGITFYQTKKYDEAMVNFTKVISMKQDHANAYYMRGLSEFYKGDKAASCADVKKAVSLGFQAAVDAMPRIGCGL